MKYNVITNENIIQFVDSDTGLLEFFYNKSEIDSLAIDNNIINIVVNGRSNVYNYNEDFENLNGSDVFDKDDVITAFIEGVGSIGIGGAGGSTIDTNHIFTDNTARDTYFTTNLSEIKSGLNILVGGVLQVWTNGNEPASYDNTYWHDYSTPLTATEIKTLYESNTNTEVLETSKKEILDKLSTNPEGNIVSSTSWIFPPNSIYIGNNAILSNALRGLNLTDPILNKRGLLLAQIYDESGSQEAFTYKIEPISTVTANDTIGEIQNTAQFVRTPTNDEIIESFHIQTDTSNNNTGVEIIFRLDSHTSENEIIRYNKQIQSNGSGILNVTLPNPIVTDANLDLYIEMNIIGMQGSQVGGVFVPKHTADIQLIERKIIVTEDRLKQPYIQIRRTSDLTIGSETLLTFTDVTSNREIIYNNGVFEIQKNGLYQVDFFCYVYESSDPTVYVWVEKSIDGINWIVDGTMIKNKIRDDTSSTIPISALFRVSDDGSKFRIKMKESGGTAILRTQSLTTSLGVVKQYASELAIVRVSDL